MEHQINKIDIEYPPDHDHPHISRVKLSNLTVETRAQVVKFIREYKTTYVTSAPEVPAAKVIVATCPECGSGGYLTTESDAVGTNDLLALPTF